jgi:hypothetical protein
MGQSDQEQLLACAVRERELAARSFDEMVRATHLKLAHEYAMRAHGEDLLARVVHESS